VVREQLEVQAAALVIEKDGLAAVAALRDVMPKAGNFLSRIFLSPYFLSAYLLSVWWPKDGTHLIESANRGYQNLA